jgi:thiamine-phosphate pyrophosphorylase
VHLGDEDLPPEEARQVLGPDAVIGVTVRSGPAAVAAQAAGADYVGVGPVFSTRTKQVAAGLLGTSGLAQVVLESPVPVIAIAGIGLVNIAQVAATGAHGAAVVSDLLLSADWPKQVRALQQEFERGWPL